MRLRGRVLKRILAFLVVITMVVPAGITVGAASSVDLNREAAYSADEGNIARMDGVTQLADGSNYYVAGNPGTGLAQTGVNAQYSNAGGRNGILRINDGRTNQAAASAWNNWGSAYGVESNPVYVVYKFATPYVINSMRAEFSSDGNGYDSGTQIPRQAFVEYWDDGASAWVRVANASRPEGDELGDPIETTGNIAGNFVNDSATSSTNNSGISKAMRQNWNKVVFDDPIVASVVRLCLTQRQTGNNNNGIGVSEWEVFGVQGDPELLSVSVGGLSTPVVSTTNTYQSYVTFPNLEGVTYEWSVDSENIAIVGAANESTVTVSAENVGAGKLTVVAKHDSGKREVTGSFDINVLPISVDVFGDPVPVVGAQKTYTATAAAGTLPVRYEWRLDSAIGSITVNNGASIKIVGNAAGPAKLTCRVYNEERGFEATDSIDLLFKIPFAEDYTGATAAGRAPILPRRVVVDGIRFDLPTESRIGEKDWDFAESFEEALIPVVWDMSSFSEADYAADKAGTTFTVTGMTAEDSRAPGLATKAIFTVNEPRPPITYNHSVTSENVIFDDIFWAPKQMVNATTSLDAAATQLAGSASYAERNFVNALGRLQKVWAGDLNPDRGIYSGYVFQDTDIYKTLEGYAYNLAAVWDDESITLERKNELLAKARYWISLIEGIQYADGYINSCFSNRSTTSSGGGGTGDWRWMNMARHEMYNIGHFLEAAVAYTRFAVSTGQEDAYVLYEVGRRTADHIVNFFGPDGIRVEVPGHEEVELAMMKFAELCEEYEGVDAGQKYRDTVELLVDRRGRRTGEDARESGYRGGEYSQDATPLVDETRAVGHAVRAMYFYTGATDIALALADDNPNKANFLKGITAIYDTASERNTYITGGLGSGESSEGFGADWRIRNQQAYLETCAAIAGANWYQRLNLFYEDAKYADSYERALYNGALAGVNLQGNRFAYGTGLDGTLNRGTWQGCACCPPNIIRTIANMGGYMYTVRQDNVFVNMFGGSTGHISVMNEDVVIRQETEYPWKGFVKMTVTPSTGADKEMTLHVRIPGWIKAQKYQTVTMKVDGVSVDATPNDKGYVVLDRTWSKDGTVIEMDMPMEVRFTESDDNTTRVYSSANADSMTAYDDRGQGNKVAIERGPIVYNLDQPGVPNGDPTTATEGRSANDVFIPRDFDYEVTYRDDLLRGVVEITGYAAYGSPDAPRDQYIQLTPYYAKENRGNNPQNDGMTSVTGTSSNRVFLKATGTEADIRTPKSVINVGETTKLTANPKINLDQVYVPEKVDNGDNSYSVRYNKGQTLSYEWNILAGGDVVEMVGEPVAAKTDEYGLGKIGGLDFTRETSIAEFAAKSYGVATVEAVLKDGEGNELARDKFYVEVIGDISVNDNFVIEPQPMVSALAAEEDTYGASNVLITAKEAASISVIVAQYGEDGALTDVEIEPLTLEAGQTYKKTVEGAAGAPTKVFFWDEKMAPVSYAYAINAFVG